MGKSKKNKTSSPRFFKVSHGATSCPEFISLPHSAKVLYLHLCQLRNSLNTEDKHTSDFSFWRWDKQLIKDTGMSRTTLYGCRKLLADACLVSCTKNKKGATLYLICDDIYAKEMEAYRDFDALDHSFDYLVPAEDDWFGDNNGSVQKTNV